MVARAALGLVHPSGRRPISRSGVRPVILRSMDPSTALTPPGRRSSVRSMLAFNSFYLCQFVAGAMAVVLVMSGAACARKAGAPGGGFKMPPTPVEVAHVHPQVVRDQFHALGTLEAHEVIEVVGEVNAIVSRIRFAEGQPVASGATLVELDDREIRADAARATALSEQAKSNFDRAEKLSAQEVVSKQQLDDARAAHKVAEANEEVANARLAKTRIRAPWSGLIGRKKVSPGAYIHSGDEIAELARVDEMKVAFAVPERYLTELRIGIQVEVTTPAFPGEMFSGKVTVVDPIVEPSTRTVQVVARIPNPGLRLRPGLSANVSVTFAERSTALMVPDESVFAEGVQNFVYVVKPDSTVARTAIELGARDSSRVEVLKGLEAGSIVVRAGHQKLYEGAKVMPVESEPGADEMPASAAPAAAAGAPGMSPKAATEKGSTAAQRGSR